MDHLGCSGKALITEGRGPGSFSGVPNLNCGDTTGQAVVYWPFLCYVVSGLKCRLYVRKNYSSLPLMNSVSILIVF